jgi:hypothetical protein
LFFGISFSAGFGCEAGQLGRLPSHSVFDLVGFFQERASCESAYLQGIQTFTTEPAIAPTEATARDLLQLALF